jgi:hypothetical protein
MNSVSRRTARLQSKRFLYGEYVSWQLHQRFKDDVIAKLARTERWAITGEQIARWLELQPKDRSIP